jgi:hypothetical protein
MIIQDMRGHDAGTSTMRACLGVLGLLVLALEGLPPLRSSLRTSGGGSLTLRTGSAAAIGADIVSERVRVPLLE